jgi:putative ABC transport system substrate-binding protein
MPIPRRHFMLALGTGALTVPLSSSAQQAPYRIGFLSAEAASDQSQARRLEVLRAALRELGYTEGKNIVIEARWAAGKYERLPALAAELVALKASVIVTSGSKATVAAKNATAVTPIVMGTTGDPVGLGLTTNLARPSANVTGWTNFGAELGPKLLELLKQAAPRITKVAYLVNPADLPPSLPVMQSSAEALRVGLTTFEARGPDQLDRAFSEMVRTRSDAVVVQPDTLFAVNVHTIAQRGLQHRLASASSLSEFADVGGLIAYGPDRLEGFRRAAAFVDKLLKGAKPADLAIERPTKFERVINMRTAKALGLTIPHALLLSADRVVE